MRKAAPPDGSVASGLADAFVPHVAVIVGVLMAISSVGVLIFFIHHVPESIHVSNILATIGRGLNERIESQFPARVGDPYDQEGDRRPDSKLSRAFYDSAVQIKSTGTGYLEYIDGESLMRLAVKHDLTFEVQPQPGDFVTPSNVLLLASPTKNVDDLVKESCAEMFIRGSQRTTTQDLRFQINQLVEVAIRALSPGVNDPFTAMNCLDWL